jgi:adenylyl-sulfate kinase
MPGTTIWITGLPASGKSTLARAIAALLETQGRVVEILDGEEARARLSPDLGFSHNDRHQHVSRLAAEARRIGELGRIAIVAAISPYQVSREAARRVAGGKFLEVYARCPLDVCRSRDPKSLFRRAAAGELRQVTGVDDPYEPPENADVVVDTHLESPEQCAKRVIIALE